MSSSSEISRNNEHQKIWDLLPWFVNQSLNTTEQAMVENHIKTCVTCRIELNQQQQVYKTIQQTDLMQQVSKASFNRLKKRIEEKPIAITQNGQEETKKSWRFIFPLSGWIKYTAFATLMLLLITPLAFNVLLEQPATLKGEYRTLAQSPEPGQSHQKSAVIRIIFADEADDGQIKSVIDSLSNYRISGPFRNGMYEVHIDGAQVNSSTITEAITQLRHNDSVFFAELAHEPLSSDQAQQ